MKIAKIFLGNPNNRKGQFNNCHERTKRLKEVATVDAYFIRPYNGFWFRLFKRDFSNVVKEEYTILDNIKYKNIWVKLSLIDYILTKRLKLRAELFLFQLEKYISLFKEYDIVSSHSMEGGYLAYLINQEYGIPYSTSWHGSDINILPFENKKYFETIKLIQKKSICNFFVSKKLLEISTSIYKGLNNVVLYTGVSSAFFQLSKTEINKLKQKYNIKTKYVVGYIGNFVTVKNVLILPKLFQAIQDKISDITFITVGNGKLETEFLKKIEKFDIKNYMHLGKQEPEVMPEIMNCLNVILLPSFNEGLPRVTIEALKCGVSVVGSDRGGIPETIGDKNIFSLNDNFVVNVSNRVSDILQNNEDSYPLSSEFSWKQALKKEMNIYISAMRNN